MEFNMNILGDWLANDCIIKNIRIGVRESLITEWFEETVMA